MNTYSIIYKIPCNTCPSAYYGETHLGLDKRLKDHKNDMRNHRISNSLVMHLDKYNHLPKWKEATILNQGLHKYMRKTIEAAYICVNKDKATNHRDGFLCWATPGAHIASRRASTKPTRGDPAGT